ncbi:MAG TPA: DNA-binding protein WhiA, partial [Actinobacteria bacterium]|nr:DNA-binding protein WhiA [Actinomycetota bacterium]
MAYTEELVSKLSHSVSKETCCRLAMLSAIVKIDGSIHLGAKSAISLELKISNMALSRRIISEFKSLFGLHSEVSLRRINIRGTTQSQILIKSNQLRAVLEKLEVLQAGKLNLGMPKNVIKRTCCKSYFLRGAFMAGGYISQSARTA